MGNSVSHCEEAALPGPAIEEVEEKMPSPHEEAEEVQDQQEEDQQEEEEEEPKREIVVDTAPLDPRFPATNQARHCFVKYNEAHKCFAEKGQDSPDCARVARDYRTLCPVEWIERWNEARENGSWWGKY